MGVEIERDKEVDLDNEVEPETAVNRETLRPKIAGKTGGPWKKILGKTGAIKNWWRGGGGVVMMMMIFE